MSAMSAVFTQSFAAGDAEAGAGLMVVSTLNRNWKSFALAHRRRGNMVPALACRAAPIKWEQVRSTPR